MVVWQRTHCPARLLFVVSGSRASKCDPQLHQHRLILYQKPLGPLGGGWRSVYTSMGNGDGNSSRACTRKRETGHLSDAGIEAIYKLFDEGCSIEETAKRMGISFRGAASRRQTWAKYRNKLSLAEAGTSPPATI